MKTHYCLRIYTFLWLAIAAGCSLGPAAAQSPADWRVAVTAKGASLGNLIGIAPWGRDGYADPEEVIVPASDWTGIFVMNYRHQSADWAGPDGLFAGDVRLTPVPAGASRTWSDFYLWAQNFTPSSANVVRIYSGFGYPLPPAGYRGHLVLDYVPTSCNWTGPMDYWLDLTSYTELALPIPIVTNPLDGTRFHLTVHAPVPEPSCLAALATGITAVGGCAIRRRRA